MGSENADDTMNETESFIQYITRDKLPANLQFIFDPLSRENERLCENINLFIKNFFKESGSSIEYGLLVVNAMEHVDKIKNLKSKDKYIIVTRCVIEIIYDDNTISEGTKYDLIKTIPGTIDAVIQLTKGEPINRNIKDIDMVDPVYITKRATERIVEYIRQKKYTVSDISENMFMIISQIMYIVGNYPSLSGNQKKEIVINVSNIILNKFKESDTGKKVPGGFIDNIIKYSPDIINILVDVSKGKYDINTIKKYFSCCIKGC